MKPYLKLLLLSSAVFCCGISHSQTKWHFSSPQSFLYEQDSTGSITYRERTQLAPVMYNYEGYIYMAWTGETYSSVSVKNLGATLRQTDTSLAQNSFDKVVFNQGSLEAPALASAGSRLYLFMASKNAPLTYSFIDNGGDVFNTDSTWTLSGLGGFNCPISAGAYSEDQIMLGMNPCANEAKIFVFDVEKNGQLTSPASNTIDLGPSLNAPSICYLEDGKVAVAWTNYDPNGATTGALRFNIIENGSKVYSNDIQLNGMSTSTPILSYNPDSGDEEVLLVWKGIGSDSLLYRASFSTSNPQFNAPPPISSSIKSTTAPSVTYIDDNNRLMIYKSAENNYFQISDINTYTYERWMGQLDSNLTLGSITIPGSHDAGMSRVANCSVGANECDAQTQVYSIEDQLNKGFRYFDIRPSHIVGSLMFTGHYAATSGAEGALGCDGEAVDSVFSAVNSFLTNNPGEIVILNVSHLNAHYNVTSSLVKSKIQTYLSSLLFTNPSASYSMSDLAHETISSLSGKVIISSPVDSLYSENYIIQDIFESDGSTQRVYADTDDLETLLQDQQNFVQRTGKGYTRLDWQLTQQTYEFSVCAGKVNHCADGFELSFMQISKTFLDCGKGVAISALLSPLAIVNGVALLVDDVSILALANKANNSLEGSIADWTTAKYITSSNRINIVYVDASDSWVTDLCIDMSTLQ